MLPDFHTSVFGILIEIADLRIRNSFLEPHVSRTVLSLGFQPYGKPVDGHSGQKDLEVTVPGRPTFGAFNHCAIPAVPTTIPVSPNSGILLVRCARRCSRRSNGRTWFDDWNPRQHLLVIPAILVDQECRGEIVIGFAQNRRHSIAISLTVVVGLIHEGSYGLPSRSGLTCPLTPKP